MRPKQLMVHVIWSLKFYQDQEEAVGEIFVTNAGTIMTMALLALNFHQRDELHINEDTERHDSATVKFAKQAEVRQNPRFDLNGLMISRGKQTGHLLGMGTNMYPSSALLGQYKDESIIALPVDELIKNIVGFTGLFLGEVAISGGRTNEGDN
nr:plasma membrane ATPase 1-like [Tanacetum cinerariifolium]